MSPWSLAKVFGMHTMAKEKGWKVSNAEIAKLVWKVGSKPLQHPSDEAIRLLRATFDEDPHWYPGKGEATGGKPGPKVVFSEQKKIAISKAAMAMKAEGHEPTAAAVIARCPKASLNPNTGKAFDEKLILEVFRTKCYDVDPSVPWGRFRPLAKTALPEWLEVMRCNWGKKIDGMPEDEAWYHRHCVWMDPCSTIIPCQPRTIFDVTKANNKKGDRWMSKDARIYSKNLGSSPYAGKQKSYGDLRVWWFVVFTRGVVRLVIMDDTWKQNSQGMATMVRKLPRLLDSMCGDSAKPRVIFSDRGPGFYNTGNGKICVEYARALKEEGFRPFAGEDASWQPADIADILLHESVVAGIRKYFRGSPIKWVEGQNTNYNNFVAKLKDCEKHINKNHNLKKLSHDFPMRVKKLVKDKGRRQRW